MRLRVSADQRPEISTAFRKARNSIGISQEELAARLGSSQDAVSRWERGKDSPPISALIALTEMLPERDRAWWRERTGSGAAEESVDVSAKIKETETLDRKLLAQVLEAVERAMNKVGGFFSTEIRAEILAEVYDYWRRTGQRDDSLVEGLVNRARGPYNRKVRT